MSAELKLLSDEEIIRLATERKGSQVNWVATEELTKRALENEQLWDAAFTAIGGDRAIKPHYIPYGSHVSVAHILDSGNEQMIRRLLHEMDAWTAYEQEDAIGPWAGYKRVAEATRDLHARYGWLPKYMQN